MTRRFSFWEVSKICNEAWTDLVKHGEKNTKIGIDSPCLVGGFKDFLFSPLFGHFD